MKHDLAPSQGIIILFAFCSACAPPQETPSQKEKTAGIHAVDPAPVLNNSEKHVLDGLLESARESIRVSDWPAATRAITDGLKKTDNRPGLEIVNAHFLMLRGDIGLEMGNEPDARRYFTDAMAVFHVHKNEAGRFAAFTALGRLEARRGDYAAAERQFDQAETLRKNLTNQALAANYLVEKGRLASRQMKRTDSIRFFQEALSLFEVAKDKRSSAEVLVLLSFEEDQTDQSVAARRNLERAVALFDETKDMQGKVRAIHRLATYAEREKQTAKAARLYAEAAALYRSLGQETAAANVDMHLATLSPPEDNSKKK